MTWPRRRSTALLAAAALMMTVPDVASARPRPGGDWASYNRDAVGSRHNRAERVLSRRSVERGLRVRWRHRTTGPVYGTPAVVGGRVYAADISGYVHALDASSGAVAWITRVGPASAFPLTVTASPLVTETAVIIGDQNGTVWGLDRSTGLPRWVNRPNPHGHPAVYGSASLASVRVGTARRTVALIGFSANDETFTPTAVQPCCLSRGSVAALDPETGAVLWHTYLVTDAEAAGGASGASVWSTPTYDRGLNRVFVTTGNNYGNREDTPVTATSDAVVALDAATGSIVWVNQRTPNDTWAYAYRGFPEGHPDADFGDSPQVFQLADGRTAVAAGQKSGFLHLLDAKTGDLIDHAQFMPGGGLGGLFADSAFANGVVFANGNDWTDYGGGELGAAVETDPPKAGAVVAVRTLGGRLEEAWRFSTPGSPMLGAVAVANDVVYVHGSRTGRLYALDARSGRVLAQVRVGAGINGPSVSRGRIYLGTGDVVGMAAQDPTSGSVVAIELSSR